MNNGTLLCDCMLLVSPSPSPLNTDHAGNSIVEKKFLLNQVCHPFAKTWQQFVYEIEVDSDLREIAS